MNEVLIKPYMNNQVQYCWEGKKRHHMETIEEREKREVHIERKLLKKGRNDKCTLRGNC